MENPATHGKAEKIVRAVLDDFFINQAKPITDETKKFFGLSLERQITDALREENLIREDV